MRQWLGKSLDNRSLDNKGFGGKGFSQWSTLGVLGSRNRALLVLFASAFLHCDGPPSCLSDRESGNARSPASVRVVVSDAVVSDAETERSSQEDAAKAEEEALRLQQREEQVAEWDRLDLAYPNHGVVVGVHLAIRPDPSPSAEPVVGWLRAGAHIRLKPRAVVSDRCASGWHETYPSGWVCLGQGVKRLRRPLPRSLLEEEVQEVEQKYAISAGTSVAPSAAAGSPQAAEDQVPAQADALDGQEAAARLLRGPGGIRKDSPLPYRYFFVKETLVPEYHRLPPRESQWEAERYVERYISFLRDKEPENAALFLAGELEDEPTKPLAVKRFLVRGFYSAAVDIETRDGRQFIRTPTGSYVKLASLVEREGATFRGLELDANLTLPVAFAVREGHWLLRKGRGSSTRFVRDASSPSLERLSVLPTWTGTSRVGRHNYHEFMQEGWEEPRYLRSWYAGVAKRMDPPKRVADGEPWIHVDVSQQTMVLYRGAKPEYATLVSTGMQNFPTPIGTFDVDKKLRSATMSALGPDAGDDQYRIEDVPWTQYFEGAMALHAAFWHDRFGIRRSHGCVNLSPWDAWRAFQHSRPELPRDWHGAVTHHKGFSASLVVVTE